jgi:O-antigen/teichoic acid export membrane protein
MGQRPANDHAKTVRDALSKNVVVDIGARVGYLVTCFSIPTFVLAHVGSEAYGLWATTFIIVSYVGISTFGISNVYIKYGTEYTARGEPQRANALLSTGLVTTTALCLIIFALLLIWWPLVVNWLQVPDALQDDASEVILLVVGIFLASLAFSGFSNALTGVQRQAAVQGIWVVAYVVETASISSLIPWSVCPTWTNFWSAFSELAGTWPHFRRAPRVVIQHAGRVGAFA